MRPSGETQIISAITSPAPPIARAPRWTRWKSPGVPSTEQYMSIGETTTRLSSSSSRRRNGVNIGGRPRAREVERAQAERREHRRAPVERGVDAGDKLGVAQLELAVGDPAAAGQEVEREDPRVLAHVAL